MTIPVDLDEEEVKRMALSREKIKKSLNGRSPKKIFYVRGRVINIVV